MYTVTQAMQLTKVKLEIKNTDKFRGRPVSYCDKDRADIGRYATENGPTKHFSKILTLLYQRHLQDINKLMSIWFHKGYFEIISHSLEFLWIKTHGSVSCGPRSRRATP